MPGPLPQYPIVLSGEQAEELSAIALSYTCCYSLVIRARILLLAHQHPTIA